MYRVNSFSGFEPVLDLKLELASHASLELVELVWGHKTYLLVNVPATMSASFLGLCASLVHLEMPVHVSRLLSSPLFISPKSPAALRTRRS